MELILASLLILSMTRRLERHQEKRQKMRHLPRKLARRRMRRSRVLVMVTRMQMTFQRSGSGARSARFLLPMVLRNPCQMVP